MENSDGWTTLSPPAREVNGISKKKPVTAIRTVRTKRGSRRRGLTLADEGGGAAAPPRHAAAAWPTDEPSTSFGTRITRTLMRGNVGCTAYATIGSPTGRSAAVYRLDWEGRVDFVSADEVTFRIDRHATYDPPLPPPLPVEPAEIVAALEVELQTDPGTDRLWDAERIARLAMHVAPTETALSLRDHVSRNGGRSRAAATGDPASESASNSWRH